LHHLEDWKDENNQSSILPTSNNPAIADEGAARANTESTGTGSGVQNSSAVRFMVEWDGAHHTSRFGYVKIEETEL
jgi:hypothetical protein